MSYFRRNTKNIQYATKNRPVYGMKYDGLATAFSSILNRNLIRKNWLMINQIQLVLQSDLQFLT